MFKFLYLKAVNAYYACYLFYEAIRKKEKSLFAHLLLAMEIQAVKMYWQMPDNNVYDNLFASQKMAGNYSLQDILVMKLFIFWC